MQSASANAAEALEKVAGLLERKPPKGKRRSEADQAAIKAALIDAEEAVRELGPGIASDDDDPAIGWVETWRKEIFAGRFYKVAPNAVRAIARRCSRSEL